MVSENQREEITVSDGLQLGRSTVDTTDVKMVEDEVNTLQKQVAEVSHHSNKIAMVATSIVLVHGYASSPPSFSTHID